MSSNCTSKFTITVSTSKYNKKSYFGRYFRMANNLLQDAGRLESTIFSSYIMSYPCLFAYACLFATELAQIECTFPSQITIIPTFGWCTRWPGKLDKSGSSKFGNIFGLSSKYSGANCSALHGVGLFMYPPKYLRPCALYIPVNTCKKPGKKFQIPIATSIRRKNCLRLRLFKKEDFRRNRWRGVNSCGMTTRKR